MMKLKLAQLPMSLGKLYYYGRLCVLRWQHIMLLVVSNVMCGIFALCSRKATKQNVVFGPACLSVCASICVSEQLTERQLIGNFCVNVGICVMMFFASG